MMVLRVAMISFHSCPALAPGSGKVGGMNVYIIELAKELSLLGLEIDFLPGIIWNLIGMFRFPRQMSE